RFNQADALLLITLAEVHLQDRTRVSCLRFGSRNSLRLMQMTKRYIVDLRRKIARVHRKDAGSPLSATKFTFGNMHMPKENRDRLPVFPLDEVFQSAKIVLHFTLIRVEPDILARASTFCGTQDLMWMKIWQATNERL